MAPAGLSILTTTFSSGGDRNRALGIWGAISGLAAALLIYGLVRAPEQGWGSARTTGELATAGVALAAFTVIELRRRHPLFPFSIFRVKGLAAADAVQMIAFAAFVSVFYFLTLYMQNVIGYGPIRSGSAYLPVTAGIIAAAGVSAKLFARTGTRPLIVAGALIAAAGVSGWRASRSTAPTRATCCPGW